MSPCLAWQDTERFQARSQELEQKLLSKERELEQLVQKQKWVGSCLCPHPLGLTAPSAVARAHCPCHSFKDMSFQSEKNHFIE